MIRVSVDNKKATFMGVRGGKDSKEDILLKISIIVKQTNIINFFISNLSTKNSKKFIMSTHIEAQIYSLIIR